MPQNMDVVPCFHSGTEVNYVQSNFRHGLLTLQNPDLPTTHQELYAVKWALEQNRPYLLDRPNKAITDHANLKFLTSISPQQSKLAHFDFTLEHQPGKEHVVPDTLSRAPLPEPSTTGDNLVVFPAPVAAFLSLPWDTTYLFSIPSW